MVLLPHEQEKPPLFKGEGSTSEEADNYATTSGGSSPGHLLNNSETTASMATIEKMALPNLLRRRSTHSLSSEARDALNGVDLARPLYKGRVFKQFSNEQGFNKRFFVLYPGLLLYYKHERDFDEDLRLGMVCSIVLFSIESVAKFRPKPAYGVKLHKLYY